jgi:hypothetical protein
MRLISGLSIVAKKRSHREFPAAQREKMIDKQTTETCLQACIKETRYCCAKWPRFSRSRTENINCLLIIDSFNGKSKIN